MKKMIAMGWVWAMGLAAGHAAEEAFSRAVRAEDFAAAGLAKLSPGELARLDALVRDFKGGAPAVRADAAGGVKEKKVVRLAAGTEVEYGAVESRIAGDFTGWEGRAVFVLENGQRWQVANGGSYYTPKLASPKVTITPAPLGGFWMAVEGVATRVRVMPWGAK